MSQEEKASKFFEWGFWARENQVLPEGEWATWLILAGRGFGKTRTGAESIREWIRRGFNFVNLIGATANDLRDIMVEGESGILSICPPSERPTYKSNARQLHWPNGAISMLFTAEEPDRLRGKQHSKLWCDELAAWRYSDSWDQAQLGLRLGVNPQAIVTTTPRPTRIIKELVADSSTRVTRGSTYDNRANLPATFFSKIISKYEGTRLGRQELDAEILNDTPGALWSRAQIDKLRVRPGDVPDLKRVVVAIDPATSTNEKSDETGIICAGVCENGQGYILEDVSGRYHPSEWAAEAIALFKNRKADRIVAEVNAGGEMIENTLRTKDPNIPYKSVRASRGKVIRAEPIAALYEQGRIHHVGSLAKLEDQMCVFSSDYDRSRDGSPDRLDAAVWALTDLMVVEDSHLGFLGFMRQQADKFKAAAK